MMVEEFGEGHALVILSATAFGAIHLGFAVE
jgi:hypothetical protein